MTPAAIDRLVPGPLRGIVYTDLDGTLLDFASHEPSAGSLAAVERLRSLGVATVPVTSKTAAEVRHLARIARVAPVAVVEGGAVFLGPGGGPEILGRPRAELIQLLQTLKAEGWPLRGLSEMDASAVTRLTGLPPEAAARALDRLASEPFLATSDLSSSDEAGLRGRIAALGGNLQRGGRFWHLLGAGIDKGSAVNAVAARIPEAAAVFAAGVGDAWNDLPMLRLTSPSYLLGDAVPDGDIDFPVVRIPFRGPQGFVRAVAAAVECIG